MKKLEFLQLCSSLLKEQGFRRKKNNFYKHFHNGVTLTVWLHSSFFDNHYYIEFAYSFERINRHLPYPEYYEADVRCGRLRFGFSSKVTELHYFEIAPEDFAPQLKKQLEQIIDAAKGGESEIVRRYIDIKPCSKAILNGTAVAEYLKVEPAGNIRIAETK